MLTTYEQRSKRKLVATILSVVIIAGVVVFADHLKSGDAEGLSSLASSPSTTSQSPSAGTGTPSATSTTAPSAGSSSSPASANSSGYKDGTYAATSNYYVPHGYESIRVNLTLKNGTVTNATIQNSESNGDSAMFQQNFASAYKSYVVGRKINSLRLDVVGGASDTTQGFNEAVAKISSEAQA